MSGEQFQNSTPEGGSKSKGKAPPHAFKPGQSGNPGGRPKSDLLKELAAFADRRVNNRDSTTNCQALAEKAWEKAREGNLEWARWIANRLHGRSDLAINLRGKLETTPPTPLPPLSKEALIALTQALQKDLEGQAG